MPLIIGLKKFTGFLTKFITNSAFVISVTIIAPAVSLAQEDAPAANPSRPSITNSPDLGPAGHYEINYGATAFSSGSTMWTSPLLLKYTFAPNIELRLGTNGMSIPASSNQPALGPRDAGVMVQWIPSPAVDDEIHWAVSAAANVPLSGGVAAPDAWDYSTGLALGKNIYGLIWQCNVNVGASGDGDLWLGNFVITELLAYSVGRWSPFADFAYSRSAGDGAVGITTVMVGTGYAITPQFVLDAGIAAGFGGQTTARTVLIGFSVLY